MNTIVIAGASGVVGRQVLQHLLQRSDVDRVIAIGRRTLPIEHEKLVSAIADMASHTLMAEHIVNGAAVALCCLGTTMKRAGSQEAFRAVDRDAVVAFAKAAVEQSVRRFVLISSIGADPGSRNFYLKTKGEAESAVAGFGFEQLTILRPSFIDDQGTRNEYRAAERLFLPLARLAFSVIGRNSRYAPITADALGKAMVRFAFDESSQGVRILQGPDLHAGGR